MARTCTLMASHGFRDALEPPAIFELAPGHSIEVSRTGVTIEYAGQQRKELMEFGSINAVLLEPRVTRLMSGHDRSQPRYFLEFESPAGVRVRQTTPITLAAWVGGFL